MTESLSDWLALREPADVPARSAALTRAIVDALGRHNRLDVLDLGAGTGSNLRYLASRLPAPQRWLLVDRDPALLAEAPARTSSWAAANGYEVTIEGDQFAIRGRHLDCRVATRQMDLGPLADPQIFSGRHLVTASALLDLVSDAWLGALAALCRGSRAAVLFTLTYTGRSHCSPEEPEDDTIRELMNRHQRGSDKGFGRAAGPEAVACAARHFAAVGYHVQRAASDWVLLPDTQEPQRRLVGGWAEAAVEIAPDQAEMVASWLARRLAHVEAHRSRVIVGHEDLAAWLPSESL
jgi:SAM-dependent methyltransferase